jgi:hypothetical protein
MDLESLVLGGTLNFTTLVPDYLPADGWVLKYVLVPRSAGPSSITLTGTQDADDATLHRIQVAASTTAGWTSGVYSWASWVQLGSEKYDLASGVVTLLPDPRTATSLDTRSQARIALDQAKAALAAWTPTTRSYRIGDRQMEFAQKADILGVISYWEIEVAREENCARAAVGLKTKRQVYLRVANG